MDLESKIRIISHQKTSAAFSLAIDRALLRVMNEKLKSDEDVDPIMRTYQFTRPAVVMGFNQKVEGRFNQEIADRKGVDLTVRDTGGGHMYFSPQDIHFAFIAPIDFFKGSLIERYQAVNSMVVSALRKLGIDAFLGRTSIRVNKGSEKLLAGTARRHASHAFLHQGGVLVNPYNREIFDLLMAREDERDLWKEKVTFLGDLHGGYFRLPRLIANSFPSGYENGLIPREISYAEDFYYNVYTNREKIFSGTKDGDLCLIAGERSTKNKEQEAEL